MMIATLDDRSYGSDAMLAVRARNPIIAYRKENT